MILAKRPDDAAVRPSAQPAGQRGLASRTFPTLPSLCCLLFKSSPSVPSALSCSIPDSKTGRFGTKTRNAQTSKPLHQALPTTKTVRPSQILPGFSRFSPYHRSSSYERLWIQLSLAPHTVYTDSHGWRFLILSSPAIRALNP